MKSRLFYLLACTALLGLSACSSDDELAQPAPAGTTSVTVTVPSGFASTRADGTSSAQSGYKNSGSTGTVYLSIYKQDGTTRFWNGSQTLGSNGRAEFKNIPVAVGAPVRYVGYATVGSKTLEGGDLQAIPLTNVLNDEEQDCFAGYLDGTTGRDMELTLTRPLCKVRLVATDWKDAQPWEVVVKSVTIKTAEGSFLLPATTLNTFSGEMTGDASTTQLASTEDEPYPNYGNESAETDKTLMADYIPVNADANTEVPTPVTIDVAYTTLGGEVQHKVINLTGSGIEGTKTLDPLPLKRNRLITIKGKVFMANADFTVIIDDELDSMWDGSIAETVAEKDGAYEISTASELAWVAQQVNSKGNTFSGKTIRLMQDIDLGNREWNPIGQTGGYNAGGTVFYGTFDGNGHTISNLKVTAWASDGVGANYASGLFGFIDTGGATIKDLTVDGATIDGRHWCGTIVGYTSNNSHLQNCKVKNAAVTCSYANDDAGGDKAGAIIGYTTSEIKGCTAENCTVKAVRDAGQVVGAAYAANVTDCTATNVTVEAITGSSRSGENISNDIIGRKL